jgi:hypothetical protein
VYHGAVSNRPRSKYVALTPEAHPLNRGLVFAGLGAHYGTARYHDSGRFRNHGTLTDMDPTDWLFDPELGRYVTNHGGYVNWASGIRPSVGEGDFSVSLYFAYNGTSSATRALIDKGYTGAVDGVWAAGISNHMVVFQTRPIGGVQVEHLLATSQGDMTVVNAPWRHLDLVRIGNTGEIHVYINGRSEGTMAGQTGDLSTARSTRLGDHRTWFSWRGKLGEFCQWDRAISPAEISLLADRSDPMYSGWLIDPTRTVVGFSGVAAASRIPVFMNHYRSLRTCA